MIDQTYFIPLNPDEERTAWQSAHKVLSESIEKKWKHYTTPDDRIKANLIGVRCEIAVSKFLGYKDGYIPYDLENRDKGDVAGLEVRGTNRDWRVSRIMLSRERDHAERRYIYCSGFKRPWIEIVGWQYGYHIMQDENKFVRPQFPDELYALEAKKLRPIRELLTEMWQTKGVI